jgi:hypothetical protein
VPRSDILPYKKVVVDHLKEARALSGIPIHMLQEFMELSSPTKNFPDIRKLALEGRYKEIVLFVNGILRIKSPPGTNYLELLKHPSLQKAISDYQKQAEFIKKELEESEFTPLATEADLLEELSLEDCSHLYL